MELRPVTDPEPIEAAAFAARVADLESQLAAEREQNSRRLSEVEPRIHAFRTTLRSLHDKLQRTASDRVQFEHRIAERAAEIESLRRDLAAARDRSESPASGEPTAKIERIEVTLPADAARIERLERELSRRDEALGVSAVMAGEQAVRLAAAEAKLANARRKIAEIRDLLLAERVASAEARPGGPASAVDALLADADPGDPVSDAHGDAPAAAPDDGFPPVPGLRAEGLPVHVALGTRYAARESDSRRPVSVLVFARQLGDIDSRRLDALLAARHRNLASAIAFGMAPAGPYVVFERAGGERAEDWVQHVGPLPERTAIAVALQVARGLREAAFHGALHGDLSPWVVRIEATGRVQVEDAGLGALDPGADRLVASPSYAAPERLRGSPPADARADIYSLGALIQFLVTGVAPFQGDREQVARRQAFEPPLDVRNLRPDVSPELARVVMKFMARQPSDRPATWDEALIEIERCGDQAPADGQEAADPEPRFARFAGAHPAVWLVAAALPIVAASIAVLVAAGKKPALPDRLDAGAAHAEPLARPK